MTTKQRITSYLNDKGWVSGTQLESQASEWGTKASVISRRARELVNDGLIERGVSDRKTVQYRRKVASWSAKQANDYLDKLRKEQGVLL